VPEGPHVDEDRRRHGAILSTVRYHLGIAAQTEPGLQAEHKAAWGAVTRETSRGLQNMADTIIFYEKEGRLPTTGGGPPRNEHRVHGTPNSGTPLPPAPSPPHTAKAWRSSPTGTPNRPGPKRTQPGGTAGWPSS
jgi:hypothetical protein